MPLNTDLHPLTRRKFVQALGAGAAGLMSGGNASREVIRQDEGVHRSMNDGARSAAGMTEELLYIPPVETHLIDSKHVAQTFKVQVMQPARKKGEKRRFPVVYATDGNWTFDMFKSISYLLQMTADDAPPFILVGVGYPSDFPHAGMILRARDLTAPPYPCPDFKMVVEPRYEGVLLPKAGTKNYHGGEEFRNFIGEELIPFIDGRYDTIPDDRIYFGHSGGGFFGLFTMFTRSHLFRKYIVSSPGVTYNGKGPGGVKYNNCEVVLQMARDFAASGKSLDGVRLYLSAGS